MRILRINKIVFSVDSCYSIRTMKASLTLVLLFFTTCLFGSLASAGLVMLGLDLRVLVAGSSFIPFSAAFFGRGILLSFPFVCIGALLGVLLYLIRHPAQTIFPIITYILLGLLSWGVFIPAATGLNGYYDRITFDWIGQAESADLTPNYFRVYDGNVYYYSKVFRYAEAARDMYGEGLMIDLKGIRGKTGAVYTFSTTVVIRDSEKEYSDVIFKEAARMPPVVAAPLKAYMTLYTMASNSVWSGVIAWLSYASLGLAMLATAWLTSLSSWRFLKAFVVVVAGIAVAVVDYLVYAHLLLPDLAAACRELFVGVGLASPQVFSGMLNIIEPLALFVNLLCFALFFVLGMVGKKLFSHDVQLAGDDE